MREHRVDAVVHAAAQTHVDTSFDSAQAATFSTDNVVGTQSLLEAARECWCGGGGRTATPHRFVHISTDEVYGESGVDGLAGGAGDVCATAAAAAAHCKLTRAVARRRPPAARRRRVPSHLHLPHRRARRMRAHGSHRRTRTPRPKPQPS